MKRPNFYVSIFIISKMRIKVRLTTTLWLYNHKVVFIIKQRMKNLLITYKLPYINNYRGKRINIVKAHYYNPGGSIVNLISKTEGNKLHLNSGFIPNIKTQMFTEPPTPNKFNKNNITYIVDIFSAINKIPKPNSLVYTLSKSELLDTTHIYNSSNDMLNVYNAKLNKKTQIIKSEDNHNYIGKPRHYPPANKE